MELGKILIRVRLSEPSLVGLPWSESDTASEFRMHL